MTTTKNDIFIHPGSIRRRAVTSTTVVKLYSDRSDKSSIVANFAMDEIVRDRLWLIKKIESLMNTTSLVPYHWPSEAIKSAQNETIRNVVAILLREPHK